MKQQNFNNTPELTENDIDQIVSILGHKCRVKTCNRLRSCLTYSRSMIKSYGILDRLIKENDQWRYIAGQSQPEEMKIIRDIILK